MPTQDKDKLIALLVEALEKIAAIKTATSLRSTSFKLHALTEIGQVVEAALQAAKQGR